MTKVKIKRIYDKVDKEDGERILVDRLWPRGISKERAQLNTWLKDIAPSDQLRKWFAHDPKRWKEFQRKYKAELKDKETAIAEMKKIMRKEKKVTLLYGAKDEEHNQAVVLKDFLTKK